MKLVLLEYVQNDLPSGFTPYRIFSIQVHHVEVGKIVLRDGSDQEHYFDGHIGYTIDEEYRGHHYAYEACLLLQDYIERDHVIITCDPDNTPSLKTIEKLGSVYMESKVIPTHLKKMFTPEEKVKRIYQWNIDHRKEARE